MRSPKPAVLAVSVGLLLFWSLVGPALAQTTGMLVSSDYELFGTTQLNGGGHVTWTLYGDTAKALRADILGLFDGYPQIPRGFVFGGNPTNGNHNGLIEEPEGLAYTDRVENLLEGLYPSATSGGTQVGYFRIDRADLLDKDVAGGFNRSTAGIVGQGVNSTSDLRIDFIFNGASNTFDVTMNLTTDAYAQALFKVFSIEADQSGSWPLQLAPRTANGTVGWQSLFYDTAHPAVLWAGNSSACPSPASNCTYGGSANFTTQTVMDSALGALGTPLDLRFASDAAITFNYTGSVADPGDFLRFQAAPDAPNLSWATLPGGNLSAAQNAAPGSWGTVNLNLSAYLGQKIRLRAQFVSNVAGNASGFFVSNFAIHAPATYSGPIVESDAHYLIGTISFSNLQVPSGDPTLFRTPGGEILFYSGSFGTASPSPDAVRYEGFDVLENPQVLFVIMVVGCFFIARLQDSAWDTFREAHPGVYRPALHKTRWLHWVGRIAILLLILFYFIPTAFFVIGLRVYVNGPAYLFVTLAATLGLGFGTRAWYLQRLDEAPPPVGPEEAADHEAGAEAAEVAEEPEPEAETVAHCTHCLRGITSKDRTYDCSCGAVYHMSCASGLMRCSNCRKPIAGIGVIGGEKRSVSMRCDSCGEVQTVPEGTDPRTLTCASCGGSLRTLDSGRRYLLLSSNPGIAFHWLADLVKGGKPAVVFTTSSPERVRLEFSLQNTQFLQVAGQAPGAVDPRKLDPIGLKAILPLAREGKGGVLLYDGLDQMVSGSSLGDVVRFLRKANDMAFVHQVTVIGRVGPGILSQPEIERLGAEFDETLDLSARL